MIRLLSSLRATMLSGACLIAAAAPAAAHDFWLEPERFQLASPGRVHVDAMVGHADDKARWDLRPERILALRSFGPDGVRDQQAGVASGKDITLDLTAPGLHLIALESSQALSELPAEKFNAYLAEEGLTSIAVHRIAQRQQDRPGRELYSRRAKTIMQVGKAMTGPDVTRPVGLTLEITPLTSPIGLEPGQSMDLEVRWRGAVLPGATVHVARLGADGADVAKLKTDAMGLATTPSLSQGAWMFQTLWAAPNINGLADYDTVFSSLSFEIK